jgi:hypothetical protein
MKVYVLAAAMALAACSSANGTPPAAQSQSTQSAAVAPATNANCRGWSGVSAEPCPLKLDKKNGTKGAVVTVSGPGVVSSKILYNGCNPACTIAPMGSGNITQWLVKSGPSCAKGYVTFAGYNESGGFVGGAYWMGVNKYC